MRCELLEQREVPGHGVGADRGGTESQGAANKHARPLAERVRRLAARFSSQRGGLGERELSGEEQDEQHDKNDRGGRPAVIA